MTLEKYQIHQKATLRETLRKIEANHEGCILVTDDEERVIAIATDGDIRRELLQDMTLDDPIMQCANTDFLAADHKTPRELLLKQLDQKIRLIPVLDKNGKLLQIVTKKQMPIQIEEPVYARARAPVRISFGGGGSDLTHFFSDHQGAVINSTISSYCHATLRKRPDLKVVISSLDLDETLKADSLQQAFAHTGKFDLILALLRTIQPAFGFELFIHSDFPLKSGLGGSSSVSAAILGCFNQFRQDRWDKHELAELAFQAERLYLDIAGGWQDQYATVFGGFNFMEFGMDQTVVNPLRISDDILLELEESLVLCNTGIAHESGEIHADQRKTMLNAEIRALVSRSVKLTYQLRNDLLRGRLLQFGQCLHELWEIKRQLSGKISNDELDEIYQAALDLGAIGGKILGAGGGGFFLFYVPPFKKHRLMSGLKKMGLTSLPFRFEAEGLHAWTIRERKQSLEQ
ncbi:MAG: CBS domain-containing protein [Cohaesibacter sp.]|nr:CBS domain-containing protein [Cohaesibacter sp.]